MSESLDMIDANFAEEDGDPFAKWLLADFAIHPLLRALLRHGPGTDPDAGDPVERPVWDRLIRTLHEFRLHFGDLTENHNLLHLSLRYLVGQYWPNQRLIDGRLASIHRAEAEREIIAWCQRWVYEGSTEWGSAIYYNVALLGLFNLADHADDQSIAGLARGVIDLYMLDSALGSFAGSLVSAAHRDYAVFRQSLYDSPSRPLHDVMFGIDRLQMFNRHFVGGAVMSACSDYRPPDAVVRIARDKLTHTSTTTHTLPAGLWKQRVTGDIERPLPVNDDRLTSHMARLPHAMLGVMNSYPSRGRYTEFVLQATLDEQAMIFVNHPSADPPHRLVEPSEALESYRRGGPPPIDITHPDAPPTWVYGNVPPGNTGDLRPGYWQGNIDGPRSFGHENVGAVIYQLGADVSMPFVHLYLPQAAFDQIEEDGHWIWLRRDEGYLGVWCSQPAVPTIEGTWKGLERKIEAKSSGVLMCIGDQSTYRDFEHFRSERQSLEPQWHSEPLRLDWKIDGGKATLELDYVNGPSIDGEPMPQNNNRVATPWGNMPLGSGDLSLNVKDCSWSLKSEL